jgi:iron-sulfur cluster assembly protein
MGRSALGRGIGIMLTITESAATKAKGLLEEKGLSQGALRVFVVGGGCSGYQYGMALAQEAEDGDVVVEEYGVKLLVDPESAPLLEGAEIDYIEDVMKSGFTIFNPNAVKSCACGSSFQTADGSGTPRRCC